MVFIATPQQLQFLRQAIDDYCRDCGVVDRDERLYVAELATSLLELGAINRQDLRRGLDDAIGPCRSRPSLPAH